MTNTSFQRPTASRPALVFCLIVVGMVAVLWITSPTRRSTSMAGATSRWAASTTPADARTRLAALPVTEPSPEVAYDRVRDFGAAWTDVDHNGCDTRNDILRRDLVDVTYRPRTDRCVVLTGKMVDPYTGALISFTKTNASAVQIDHLIPLHAAWILGAWRWKPSRRLAFANDPRNLVAVDGPANRKKSDDLADRWRPPNERIRCVYAINTVTVHASYHLAVTAAERRALQSMLDQCP